MLLPLPGPAPFQPLATDAPAWVMAPSPAPVVGFGALPGIVPTLPAAGVLLDVPGPVLTSAAAVSEATPVPEPPSIALFAAALVGLALCWRTV